MRFELHFSFDLSATTQQSPDGNRPYPLAGAYHHCLLGLIAVLVLLHLLCICLILWATAPVLGPTTPCAFVCQCYSSLSDTGDPTAAGEPKISSHGQHRDRSRVAQAQAPQPSGDDASMIEDNDGEPRSPTLSTRKTTRGPSPLVVQPMQVANSPSIDALMIDTRIAETSTTVPAPGLVAILPIYHDQQASYSVCHDLQSPGADANAEGQSAPVGSCPSDQPSSQTQKSVALHNSPLEKTLVGCNLAEPTPFVALGVGVGDDELPGPSHDIDLLSKCLPSHMFHPVQGANATRDIIYQKLREIFKAVQRRTLVVLYFTGHGNDNDNSFMLYNGESLSVTTLLDWIHEIRQETDKQLPVFIGFDHCRASLDLPHIPSEKLKDIYIIWACSPRQRAFELKLGDDVPYSEFLKAVFLTMTEVLSRPFNENIYLLERLGYWMSLTVKVHRGLICGDAKCEDPWISCRCSICFASGLCRHPNHIVGRHQKPIQTPAGWFWDFKSDIETKTGEIVPFIQPFANSIQRIGRSIKDHRWYQKHGVEWFDTQTGPTDGHHQPVKRSKWWDTIGALASGHPPLSSRETGVFRYNT